MCPSKCLFAIPEGKQLPSRGRTPWASACCPQPWASPVFCCALNPVAVTASERAGTPIPGQKPTTTQPSRWSSWGLQSLLFSSLVSPLNPSAEQARAQWCSVPCSPPPWPCLSPAPVASAWPLSTKSGTTSGSASILGLDGRCTNGHRRNHH